MSVAVTVKLSTVLNVTPNYPCHLSSVLLAGNVTFLEVL